MTTIDLDGLSAYRAEPTGDPRGGIILIHEIWGLVPHITDVADRFAAEGYVVIAPDILSDIGMTPELGQELQTLISDPDEARRTAAQPRLREALAPMRAPDFAWPPSRSFARPSTSLAAEPGSTAASPWWGSASAERTPSHSRQPTTACALPFRSTAPHRRPSASPRSDARCSRSTEPTTRR